MIRFAPLMLIALPAAAVAQAGAEAPKPITKTELTADLDTDYGNLDANADGKVDTAEINARLDKSADAQLAMMARERDASFDRLDTNKDGNVSKAEFQAQAKLPPKPAPDAKPFLARFDANKDGNISKDEFRAPTLANFTRLDANKDGTLSVAEQTAAEKPKRSADIGR